MLLCVSLYSVSTNHWSYFTDSARNGLSSAPIVGHFKFYRISNFQMFNVTTKLAKMKKQSCLSFAALYESVRVLLKQKLKIHVQVSQRFMYAFFAEVVVSICDVALPQRSTYQELFDYASFSCSLIRGLILVSRIIGGRLSGVADIRLHAGKFERKSCGAVTGG